MNTPAARLEVVAGKAAGTSILVAEELVIGRHAEGAGRLADDEEISRTHARVTLDPSGVCEIEDLGSTNGTYVNGSRISGPEELSVGDTIELGQTTLAVRELPAPRRPGSSKLFFPEEEFEEDEYGDEEYGDEEYEEEEAGAPAPPPVAAGPGPGDGPEAPDFDHDFYEPPAEPPAPFEPPTEVEPQAPAPPCRVRHRSRGRRSCRHRSPGRRRNPSRHRNPSRRRNPKRCRRSELYPRSTPDRQPTRVRRRTPPPQRPA